MDLKLTKQSIKFCPSFVTLDAVALLSVGVGWVLLLGLSLFLYWLYTFSCCSQLAPVSSIISLNHKCNISSLFPSLHFSRSAYAHFLTYPLSSLQAFPTMVLYFLASSFIDCSNYRIAFFFWKREMKSSGLSLHSPINLSRADSTQMLYGFIEAINNKLYYKWGGNSPLNMIGERDTPMGPQCRTVIKTKLVHNYYLRMGDCVSTVPPNQPLNKPLHQNQSNNDNAKPEQQPVRKQQGMKVFPQISAATQGSKVQQPRANSSFSQVKMNASSSNFSLTESHKEKMRFQMEVIRASEIDNSRVINKLAEQSQISQNNSIWNSNLHVVTQRKTLRQEATESHIK